MIWNKKDKIKEINLQEQRDFKNEISILIKKINFVDDKEEIDFGQRVKNKGIHIYFDIISFLEKQNIELTYHNLSSVHMYDKRVRDTLYSFIAFIEEYIRADIINKYEVKPNDIERIYKLQFSEILTLAVKYKIILKDDYNFLSKKINPLRNNVFHNKLILIKDSFPNLENILLIQELTSYLEKIQINNTNMKVEFIEKIKKEEEREINGKYNLNKEFNIPIVIKLSNLLK